MNFTDLSNEAIAHVKKGDLEYIQFKSFKKYDTILNHCFTTRKGGVSTGECTSLNLGFNRKDSRRNVEENYKRIAEELNINIDNMVFSNQVHDNKVKIVGEEDRGKGILRESDIIGYDGLITNKKRVALVTFYADCVPLFFFDPEKRVIALSHSGWRSSLKDIGGETVKLMKSEFCCKPQFIEVAIGPSISGCCFEVGEEVYEEFTEKYSWSKEYCKGIEGGKRHIDLQSVIKENLLRAGIKKEKIVESGICTKCRRDVFFSYRGDGGKTGSLAAFMELKP